MLEPYYGGSHKYFLENLAQNLPFQFDFLSLPARKWKWRMRLSAPYYAHKLADMGEYDRILCSSFVDVATFRSLAPAWVNKTPILTYFHENQFAYPIQMNDERDFHFALTNVMTAMASDQVAFNSEYNLQSFLAGAGVLLKKAPDMKLVHCVDSIKRKATILFPGINFTNIDMAPEADVHADCPVLLWNHRWEHDKNPELFFTTLMDFSRQGLDFKLVVAGQSFRSKPPIFKKAARTLKKHILQYGYITARKEYYKWLKSSDHVISTAEHEFYGISIIEAVRAGCRPILPLKLSYPELFPEQYLYEEDSFATALEQTLNKERLPPQKAKDLTDRFSWNKLAPAYHDWLLCI